MTGEASDVEVVIVDTHHLPFAGVSTSVALDDIGTAPGTVRILLIWNCRKKQRDHHPEDSFSLKNAITHNYNINWQKRQKG